MTKEIITKYSRDFDIDRETITEAIESLQRLGESFTFDSYINFNYYKDDDASFKIVTIREETDKEYEERLNKTSVEVVRQKDVRQKEYEKLKLEFGDD